MKLYYGMYYSLTKNDPIKVVFQRISKVLKEYRSIDGPNYFYLSDHAARFDRKPVSAVDRVLKKFPELSRFLFEAEEEINEEKNTYKVLSNFPFDIPALLGTVKGRHTENVSLDILTQIAEGIPRSYPFKETRFLFDEIGWSQNRSGDEDSAFDLNSILYINDWWTPKRHTELTAKIAIPQPSAEKEKLSPLSERNQKALSDLGQIKIKELCVEPSKEEKGLFEELESKGNDLIYSFREKTLSPVTFLYPHHLEDNVEGAYNVPRKPTISKVMKKHGYKHLSKEGFHGCLVYGKMTENNHRILLEFDSGSTFYHLRCNFTIQGPCWKQRIEEIPCRHNSNRDFYPIPDLQTLEMVTENFCATIAFMENTIVKEIENLYGPAPKWFKYEF